MSFVRCSRIMWWLATFLAVIDTAVVVRGDELEEAAAAAGADSNQPQEQPVELVGYIQPRIPLLHVTEDTTVSNSDADGNVDAAGAVDDPGEDKEIDLDANPIFDPDIAVGALAKSIVPTNPCRKYRCGAYSLATSLAGDDPAPNGRKLHELLSVNWTQVLEGNFGRSRNLETAEDGLRYLVAGVSCAYHPVRTIFDNDSMKNNNPTVSTMDWDSSNHTTAGHRTGDHGSCASASVAKETATTSDGATATKADDAVPTYETTTTLPCMADQLGGETKENYVDIKLTIPKKIHIKIYAIDDDLEFRYRSHPCDLVVPVLEDLSSLDRGWSPLRGIYGNHDRDFSQAEHDLAKVLRFVWNRANQPKTRSEYGWMARSADWFSATFFQNSTDLGTDETGIVEGTELFHPLQSNAMLAATLELWIPKYILETTTIVGPRYDYSLGIAVDADLVDTTTKEVSNETGKVGTDATATTGGANPPPRRLLTTGPPRELSVWNDGIGTSVVVDLRASSSRHGGDGDSDSDSTSDVLDDNDGDRRLEEAATNDDNDGDATTTTGTTTATATNLKFVDGSLNGAVTIRTDAGVRGSVFLFGSNTKATLVRDGGGASSTDHHPDDANSLNITAVGFREVLTVIGDHGLPLSTDAATSLDLFTTEPCPSNTTDRTCRQLENEKDARASNLFDGLLGENDDERHLKCLARPTEFFRYNCIPLSPRAAAARPPGRNPGVWTATSMVVTTVATVVALGW